MGTFSDVTARVAATQLRRALLDHSVAAIAMIDAKLKILEANSRAEEIFAPPSTSISRMAAASRGRPALVKSSTRLMVALSRSSRVQGTILLAMMAATVSEALLMSSNSASMALEATGGGTSLRMIWS